MKSSKGSSPAIAALRWGSFKISSGIWFATLLIGVELNFGFEVPTNRFRGFEGPATGGISIPSDASIAVDIVYRWLVEYVEY